MSSSYLRCEDCPVRTLPAFRPFADGELAFVGSAKAGERVVPARDHIVQAGGNGQYMFTLLRGWAYRYKAVGGGGARQILDFLLPGDLIGLQSPFTGRVRHAVCALTDVTVCEIAGHPVREVFAAQPGLGAALIETLLLDEDRADQRLLLLGRQRPTQRLAYLMLELYGRLVARHMADEDEGPFPLTYDQMSDALGLSRAQLARSLAEVRARGWAEIDNGRLMLREPEAMAEFARYTPASERPRTII